MRRITEVSAYPLEVPLKAAFETAKGRKTVSPTVVIQLTLEDGITAFGSATPLRYVTGEDVQSVLSAVDMFKGDLIGTGPMSYRGIFEILHEVLPDDHTARAGLEMAVIDAFCKLTNLPMCSFFGGASDHVQTDLTIPICPPDEAREVARQAAAQGIRVLKVKVGVDDPEEDFERVRAIHEGAPDCPIRLDANQGFVPTVAVSFIHRLQAAEIPLDMVEQPVDKDDIDGLRYVTQHTTVPVFADESAVTPYNVFKLLDLDAVDGINVKLMKSGIAGALDIIALCRAARKHLMLGSMIEPGIGVATAVHLACGTGAFDRLDLDAHMLVAEEPFQGGFTADGDVLYADTGSLGHGSSPAAGASTEQL